MADKFENPNFAVSQENLDMVNRKEREGKSVGGMTSSWTSPPDPSLIPPDKLELIRKSQDAHPKQEEVVRPSRTPFMPSSPSACLVTVPKQAVKTLLRVLPLFEAVQMNLTSEQRKMLLEALETVKTPANLMDAKAIFHLMEALGS